MRDLIGSIEAVYRGKMYRLNEIHELVHLAQASTPSAATLDEFDLRRASILAEAGAALDAISERATRVVAALEREIE